MKRGIGIIIIIALIILVVVLINENDKATAFKEEIYSVNIISIDRLSNIQQICQRCKDRSSSDCVDNLKVNYNINSNSRDSLACRAYYTDSRNVQGISTGKDTFTVAYNGANQETLISDAKEEYSVEVCCQIDSSPDSQPVCSTKYKSYEAC